MRSMRGTKVKDTEMKIQDQGMTERLSNQTPATAVLNDTAAAGRSLKAKESAGDGDNWQLSTLTRQMQNAGPISDASRADMVKRTAKAVESGSYQIDYANISRAMIAEVSTFPY